MNTRSKRARQSRAVTSFAESDIVYEAPGDRFWVGRRAPGWYEVLRNEGTHAVVVGIYDFKSDPAQHEEALARAIERCDQLAGTHEPGTVKLRELHARVSALIDEARAGLVAYPTELSEALHTARRAMYDRELTDRATAIAVETLGIPPANKHGATTTSPTTITARSGKFEVTVRLAKTPSGIWLGAYDFKYPNGGASSPISVTSGWFDSPRAAALGTALPRIELDLRRRIDEGGRLAATDGYVTAFISAVDARFPPAGGTPPTPARIAVAVRFDPADRVWH